MAATTTTLPSLSSGKAKKKELCSFCGEKTYDLTCSCGDKFDFTCVQQHAEMINAEFHSLYGQVGKQLTQLKNSKGQQNGEHQNTRALIENWVFFFLRQKKTTTAMMTISFFYCRNANVFKI